MCDINRYLGFTYNKNTSKFEAVPGNKMLFRNDTQTLHNLCFFLFRQMNNLPRIQQPLSFYEQNLIRYCIIS